MSRPVRDPEVVEMLDIATGAVGFFAVAMLVITVVLEVTGKPALSCALVLLGLVLLLALVVWARRTTARVARSRQTPRS